MLDKPIDTYLSQNALKRLFGYERMRENEILLPRHVFRYLGLSQPAFVHVRQPDQYLKIGIAFLSENERCLVSSNFQPGYAEIQAAPLDSYSTPQFSDVRLPQGLGCPLVTEVTLQLLSMPLNFDQTPCYKLEHPTTDDIQNQLADKCMIVQINDVVCINHFENAFYYRIVALTFQKDIKFYEKVLDIEDDEISAKVLSRCDTVTGLSFNQYAGYLIHRRDDH